MKKSRARKIAQKRPTATTKKQVQRNEIRFYRSNEKPYGVFSNLYRRPVEFEGTMYPTAEHAYQAGKAAKPEVRDWILSAPSPALAAMAAHGLYTWDIVPNWATIKFDRMRGVLKAKFSQHPDLAKLLLSTGNARLVESGSVKNAVNRLWGEVDGIGENMLGVMLMEIRAQLPRKRAANNSKAKTKEVKRKQRTSNRLSETPVLLTVSAK